MPMTEREPTAGAGWSSPFYDDITDELMANANAEDHRGAGGLMKHAAATIDDLRARLAAAEKRGAIGDRIIERLPLCPDHRDKQNGKDCLVCSLEAAEARERKREVLWREYEALLIAELEEVVPLAATHGWRSSRFEDGVRLRAALAGETSDGTD